MKKTKEKMKEACNTNKTDIIKVIGLYKGLLFIIVGKINLKDYLKIKELSISKTTHQSKL